MTTSEAPAETADPIGRLADVRTLSDQLPRFMRLAHAHKAQLGSESRDRAALVLLFPLHRLGPSGPKVAMTTWPPGFNDRLAAPT